MKFYLLIMILTPIAISARADSPPSPEPHISASSGGECYFKMIPDSNDPEDLNKGAGFAYRVTNKKVDKLLWSTSGWFAHQTFLTHDGRYLVRLGNWPIGREPSENDLAIAFYKDGKAIKSYSTAQIVKDKSRVRASVSHYEFYQGQPGLMLTPEDYGNGDKPPYAYGYLFKLISIDGLQYIFDVRTGRITSTRQR